MIIDKVVFQPNEDGAVGTLVHGYDPATERDGWWAVIQVRDYSGVKRGVESRLRGAVEYVVVPAVFRVAAPQVDD